MPPPPSRFRTNAWLINGLSHDSGPPSDLPKSASPPDEPNEGLTRLMRTGIVGALPCCVILGYLVGGAGAAFAVASFLIGLEVSATTAAPSLGQSAPTVNRTLKSDRMQVPPGKEPQRGERPDRDQGSGGRRRQAAPARRVRADGQRDRTVAAGAGPGTLRFLTLPFGACRGHPPSPTCGIQPTLHRPRHSTGRCSRFSRPAWPSGMAPPAIHDRTSSGVRAQ